METNKGGEIAWLKGLVRVKTHEMRGQQVCVITQTQWLCSCADILILLQYGGILERYAPVRIRLKLQNPKKR